MNPLPHRSVATAIASLATVLAMVGCNTPPVALPLVTDAGIDAADVSNPPLDAAVDASDVASNDVSTDALVNDASGPVGCNPLAITTECLLPYPSDFMTRSDPTTLTGRRLALPDGALVIPAGRAAIDLTPFNITDGFPTSSPILVHYGVAVAPSALVDNAHTDQSLLPTAPIAIFNLANGARVPYLAEMDLNVQSGIERTALIIRPLVPLDFSGHYIVVISGSVTAADGSALPVSPGFVALRDHTPSSDPRIEGARTRYEQLFTFLATNGYPRSSLGLAWEYGTASTRTVLGPALAMRDAVFAAADGPGIPYVIQQVMDNPTQWAARTVIGTFTPPNYLRADNTMAFDANGLPIPQPNPPTYPFTVVIPNQATPGPLPLTVFGHGVFGTGRDYLLGSEADHTQSVAQTAGTVLIATDWIGLAQPDLNIIVQDVVPDINNIGVVTDRLLQSLINNLALEELALGALQNDPMVHTGSTPLLDTSRVYYYGVSLGGIQGVGFTSLSRHVTRGIFAVPGGSWSNILPRSRVYAPIQAFIAATYPDELLQTEFITLLQGRFDRTDGVNLGTMLLRNPPVFAPPNRRVLIEESYGDCLVPNLTTEILARAIGMQQLTPAIYPIWGLTPLAAPQNTSVVAQYAVEADDMAYFPPSGDMLPTTDNGAHEDMVTLPNALEQVETFLDSGQVQQYCTGPCMD